MIKADALILHGKPPRERYENPELPKPHEAHWLPWLASELAQRGLNTAIPEFPRPFEPNYQAYKAVIEDYDIEQAAVIAHSAGADFILHWLSEHPEVSLRQLLLVAPWTDDKRKYGEFSDFTIDTSLPNRFGRVTIFNSLDDSPAIRQNVIRLTEILQPTSLIEFNNRGHFMIGNKMVDDRFPELLAEID